MDHPYALEIAKQRIQEMLKATGTLDQFHESTSKQNEEPRKIWDVPGYRKLFSSYSISVIGQWFDMIALMIIFGYMWKVEPYMLALIPVAYGAPQALFSQFAGVLVDRINKLKLMAVADCLTVLFTLMLFIAPSPIIALIILAIRSSVNVVHYPAQQSLIREMVPEKMRIQAITLNGGINQAAKILAPLAGGALIALIPAKNLLLINASAFFISACILFSLQKQVNIGKGKHTNHGNQEKQLTFFEQWRVGWGSVLRNPILLMTVSLTMLGMIVIQLVDAQFPILFRELASNKPELVTWVIAAVGAGSITTMYVLNRFTAFKHIGLWVCSALTFIGIGFAGLGFLQPGFSIVLCIMYGFLSGIGGGISLIISNYVIQTIPHQKDVSTVAGIFQTLVSASVFVSPLLGAVIIQLTNIQTVFVGCGLLLILFAFVPLLIKKGTSQKPRAKKHEITVD
ncbi:MFS transporter [Cytobacillus purgationiresistens]|uniref:MFS family arabinose efflux permease n=1 Tax=Cytobacillus purgationiresistens TaxID=863449 RepID=A0ABU0AMR3_9BACI|nr:MFS transporter [Cytobacillus purgationiresistens]MDQ0272537.1 putative MFS family arabinose efflux permease [Cytobacillus purgationiresistens]